VSQSKHILALVQPGTNSRDIFLDALRGFEAAGHRVTRLDLQSIWQATARLDHDQPRQQELKGDLTQLLIDLVRANRFDMAIGMWANVASTFVNPAQGGRVRTVFELLGVPLVWWWLDAPHWAHGGGFVPYLRSDIVKGTRNHHVINNLATAREMRECFGMSRVHVIRYGVDAESFARRDDVNPDHDVVMCLGPGDPEPTEALLRRLDSREVDGEAIRRDLAAELQAQVEHGFEGDVNVKRLIVELLRTQVARRHESMLQRAEEVASGDARLRQGLDLLIQNPAVYIRVTDLVRSVERFERGLHAAMLARRFRFAAFGPGVKEWAARWRVADRVTDLGVVEKLDQGAAYRRGRVAVNVMRWQDDVGINIKPLEMTAAGVACVCARRGGLSESFAIGSEVVDADSPQDMVVQVGELLGDDTRRGALARAGRQRTLTGHTWKTRSQEWVQAIFSGPASGANG